MNEPDAMRHSPDMNAAPPVAVSEMLIWLLGDEAGQTVEGVHKHTGIPHPRIERLARGADPDRRELGAVTAMFLDQWSLTRRTHRPSWAELVSALCERLVDEPDREARVVMAERVRQLVEGSARAALDGSLPS